jgi:putative DNA primase/helicase
VTPQSDLPVAQTVASVAQIWQAAGVSTIPIMANQTKRPAVKWSPYITQAPTLGEINEWWGNGKPWGLALICGAVSGNLELTEVEGRAMSSESLVEIINRMDEQGVGHIWDLLYGPEGFTEMSPSGGIHFLYRISDHQVPGNTKIAQKLPNEKGERLCLAETRGHGGYVITAPTPGICHPSGEPWTLREGQYGILPTITWEERNRFHEALRLALDETPISVETAAPAGTALATTGPVPALRAANVGSLSPGDDFEDRTDWAEILEPHGWHLEHHGPGNERHWTRPGKSTRDGASATTGRAHDRDRLYVFSTSTAFDAEVPYTKFGAFALLNFNGDHGAAARELVRRGYGSRQVPAPLDDFEFELAIEAEHFSLDDMGNGQRLADHVRGRYRWVQEEKRWYTWDGKRWAPDYTEGMIREWRDVTDRMLRVAAAGSPEQKYAQRCRSIERTRAAINMSKAFGLTYSASDFDQQGDLLNVGNGTLNLITGELTSHEPKNLLTRMFAADYDPDAKCPNFESFMASTLPDEGMRTYVQRALGYTLLGSSEQRSLFMVYGPSGTGKSTLMEAMRAVFGDYGTTAQAGTFRAPKNDKAPTNDLHELRGRRFVTTSETAESSSFDEDLLKRLSGRDRVRSRALYQESIEWIPECTIWVATNNAPKFNSDDDAIWRRTKLIPFTTVFRGDTEIYDYARKMLAHESDGILNWLLAGLREFLAEGGLGEPNAVKELAAEQRQESDSVARFLADEMADGLLTLGEQQEIRATEVFMRYAEWARRSGERALGNRRFSNRLLSLYPDLCRVRRNGHIVWAGMGRAPGVFVGGS